MLQGMTAQYLCTSTYPLRAGETCLVHAAAGGVGLLLVQMAKKRGARVIGTVSTEEKARLAREAGADDVVLYTREDFLEAVRRLTQGRGVQVVYDSVGKTTAEKSLDCLAPRGMMVFFGNASGPAPPVDPLALSRKGSLFLTRPTLGHYIADRASLEARAGEVLGDAAAGRLKVRIDRSYPLAQAGEAHRVLEARQTSGKVLLVPSSGSLTRMGYHLPAEAVARVDLPGGRAFELVVGDLLAEPVDAIVNAANGRLAHGGGVAAAIARAAGPALEREGSRIVERAGRDPGRRGGRDRRGQPAVQGRRARGRADASARATRRTKLVRALTSAFACAAERGFSSLSFPAVSSGIFAVPLPVCARAYVRAVREFFVAHPEASLRLVRLCLMHGPLVDLVRAELGC